MFTRILGLASVLGIVSTGFSANAAPTCQAGERRTIDGCRSGTAALGTHPVVAPAPQPMAKSPPKPDVSLRPTQSLLEAADRRLLVEEIARLERLVAAMPKKAVDRAMMLKRLGDD